MYIQCIIKPVRITLKKWGNSVGLRLPKVVLAQLGVAPNEPVDLTITAGTLVITKPATSLNELVDRITPTNQHSIVDWGKPVGREVW
jgi:antitoxin MazE